MTGREAILSNIDGQGSARPGMTFGRNRVNDMVSAGIGSPVGYSQRRWTEGPVEYYDDAWGNIWVRMRAGSVKGEIHSPAIVEWTDLEEYEPPAYDLEACSDLLRLEFGEPTDKFKTAHIGGWVFDDARYLRKLEIYLMDMALYPNELKRVHRMVADVYETKIQAAGKAGADGIFIGEDMGTQQGLLFSPQMWREFFSEEYTRLFGIAHEYGMKVLMHSCGQNREILPDLLRAGVDVFQFDQPLVYDIQDLAGLLRKSKAALWSPVDIQQVLPTGNREYIEQQMRLMLETFDGCLICKDYPDLRGIGVEEEWDMWAYDVVVKYGTARV